LSSTSLSIAWFLFGQYFHISGGPRKILTIWPLSPWPEVGLPQSREGLGTKQGGMLPNGIPGLPSPWSSHPSSSLTLTGLQREMDQLSWQFHLDSVSPLRKVSPQSGQKGSLINSQGSPRGILQIRDFPKRWQGVGGTVITSGVNVCVNEWPDLSSLQA
jgi:hypothetical protein